MLPSLRMDDIKDKDPPLCTVLYTNFTSLKNPVFCLFTSCSSLTSYKLFFSLWPKLCLSNAIQLKSFNLQLIFVVFWDRVSLLSPLWSLAILSHPPLSAGITGGWHHSQGVLAFPGKHFTWWPPSKSSVFHGPSVPCGRTSLCLLISLLNYE